MDARANSDETLAAECQAGSLDAYAELVTRYQGNLTAFLCRFTVNRHDAEDLTQDALVRAFREIRRYDRRRSFKTWLFTIGRNLALSEYRQRHAAGNDGRDPGLLAEPGPVEPGPVAGIMASEAQRDLWAAVAQLPAEQREVLWLFYVEEMTVRELAAVLKKSAIGTRVLLFRARRSLGRQLHREPRFSSAARLELTPGVCASVHGGDE